MRAVLSLLTRALALALGALALANVLGEFVWPGFDANSWWVDGGALRPHLMAWLPLAALGWIAFGWRPGMGPWRRVGTAGLSVMFGLACLGDGLRVLALHREGAIRLGFPLPLSFVIAAGLFALALTTFGPAPARRRAGRTSGAAASAPPSHALPIYPGGVPTHPRAPFLAVAALAGAGLLGVPLVQMWTFGQTDYRAPARAAIVLGARAYADGTLSDALEDRVRTGCELWHAGLVESLIFSGGPGDGDVHEAEAMRSWAMAHGVPRRAILLDLEGLSTRASVARTAPFVREWGAGKVLVVSHGYHLPRIKLAYQRAGVEVRTVPARQDSTLAALPRYMAREVAAAWVYWARPPGLR